MSNLHVAIQGAGHLAAALVEGFLRANITTISIYNRTAQRALELAREYPTLIVFDDQGPLTPRDVRC